MKYTIDELERRGLPRGPDLPLDGTEHEMRRRLLRPLPVRAGLHLQGWAGLLAAAGPPSSGKEGALTCRRRNRKLPSSSSRRATAASCRCWTRKTSCSPLPAPSTSRISPRPAAGCCKGPYDIGLVEGSITTPHDVERIRDIRKQCRVLITIGACATAGGIQALRNWKDVKEFTRLVYASPEYISTLDRSMPVGSYVHVDFELRGCPINKIPAAGGHQRVPEQAQADHPDPQRLHGVQAPRNGLRDGGAGDRVPRARDAGGLRGDLSVVRPRLLRVFRSDGESEYRAP